LLVKSKPERKRDLKLKAKIAQPSPNKLPLKAQFERNWNQLVTFEQADAAKPVSCYMDSMTGKDISHIYSYNKVMSIEDRKSICDILNRTDFKVLAWYASERETEASGLKNVRLLYKMPM